MTELQEFVRRRVAPLLKSLGYTGRGATYRYLSGGGYQAVVDVRSYRLGRYDLEFDVGRGFLVREWIEFVAWKNNRPLWRPFEKADRGDGPLQSSLPDPEADRTNPAGHWLLNLDDEVGIERFLATLKADARRLADLTEPRAFEAEMRAGIPAFPYESPQLPAMLLALLYATQGRVEDARAVLPGAEASRWSEDLARWVDLHDEGRGPHRPA